MTATRPPAKGSSTSTGGGEKLLYDSVALHLSDLHLGEQTQEYCLDVARDRLDAIPEMLEVEKGTGSIWVILNGDLTQGSANFATQIATSEIHTRGQRAECVKMILGVIRGTHRRFPRVRIYVRCAPGNHGKIHEYEHPDSNADLEVGDRIVDGLRGESWCKAESGRGISRVVEISGVRVAMLHQAEKALQIDPSVVSVCRPGESPRSDGIARATPAMLRKVKTRLAHYGAQLLLGGHWHYPAAWWVDEVDGQRLIYVQNGSLSGENEYGEQRAMFGRPAQSVIYFGGGVARDVRWLRW